MDNQKLDEAAKAIQRAAQASRAATGYPHGRVTPCQKQLTAAIAEVDCALALIADWQKSGMPANAAVKPRSEAESA